MVHLIVLSLKGDAGHLIALQRAVLVTIVAAAIVAASQEVFPQFKDHVAVVLLMYLIVQLSRSTSSLSVALLALNSCSHLKGCSVVLHSTAATVFCLYEGLHQHCRHELGDTHNTTTKT